MKTAKRTFKVEKSELTEMGHYFNKLVHRRTVTQESPLGNVIGLRKETYYVFTDTELTEGSEVTLDISEFFVLEKPYKVEDKETGEIKEVILKYLYPKEKE